MYCYLFLSLSLSLRVAAPFERIGSRADPASRLHVPQAHLERSRVMLLNRVSPRISLYNGSQRSPANDAIARSLRVLRSSLQSLRRRHSFDASAISSFRAADRRTQGTSFLRRERRKHRKSLGSQNVLASPLRAVRSAGPGWGWTAGSLGGAAWEPQTASRRRTEPLRVRFWHSVNVQFDFQSRRLRSPDPLVQVTCLVK